MIDSSFKGIAIRDIVVEFFGSLVPGLLFLAVCLMLVFGPAAAFLAASAAGAPTVLPTELRAFTEILLDYGEANRLLISSLLLLAGYVVGQFFHRQDIKIPDKRSFGRIYPELNPDEWVATTKEECEFPYYNLQQYLKARGLNHLGAMVPWSRGARESARPAPSWRKVPVGLKQRLRKRGVRATRAHPWLALFLPSGVRRKWWITCCERTAVPDHAHVQRTKVFINALKLRIFIYFPDKYTPVARNEAHVRLNASSWYMASLLMRVALIVLCGIAGFVVWQIVRSQRDAFSPFWIIPVAIPLAVFLIAWWVRVTIERVLHYQRVREITFVLESAYVLFRAQPWLLQDLCPGYRTGEESKL